MKKKKELKDKSGKRKLDELKILGLEDRAPVGDVTAEVAVLCVKRGFGLVRQYITTNE